MSGHWAKGYLGLAGDGPSMADIEGIDITNPQDGDTLVYNATTEKWENGAGGGGGGGAMVVSVTKTKSGDDNIYTLNKTWKEIKDALEAGTSVAIIRTNTDYVMWYYVYGASLLINTYLIDDANPAGNSYESAVQSDDPFAADSENGYPSITVSDK